MSPEHSRAVFDIADLEKAGYGVVNFIVQLMVYLDGSSQTLS
jgi:hypothetical protein